MSADCVGLARKGRVPDLERRRLTIIAEDIQCRRVEQEVLAVGGRQVDPSRRENAQDVAVREQGDVSHACADLGENAIGARADLIR